MHLLPGHIDDIILFNMELIFMSTVAGAYLWVRIKTILKNLRQNGRKEI